MLNQAADFTLGLTMIGREEEQHFRMVGVIYSGQTRVVYEEIRMIVYTFVCIVAHTFICDFNLDTKIFVSFQENYIHRFN